MKKLCVVFVVLFIISAISACAFEEIFEEEILISSEKSPNEQYILCLYQIGAPVWSFGPVKAKLVLYDAAGEMLDEESFQLFNDGTNVAADNVVEVIWSDNQVEVRMKEFDTTKQYTYILDCFDTNRG